MKKTGYSIEEYSEFLRALSDETRQEIIFGFMGHKEINVSDIAKRFALSRPTISHHLNLMKRAKLLNARKEGKEIYYSFNKEYAIGFLEEMTKWLKNCC